MFACGRTGAICGRQSKSRLADHLEEIHDNRSNYDHAHKNPGHGKSFHRHKRHREGYWLEYDKGENIHQAHFNCHRCVKVRINHPQKQQPGCGRAGAIAKEGKPPFKTIAGRAPAKPEADNECGDGGNDEGHDKWNSHLVQGNHMDAHENRADHEIHCNTCQAPYALPIYQMDDIELAHYYAGEHGEKHAPHEEKAKAKAAYPLGHVNEPGNPKAVGRSIDGEHQPQVEGQGVYVCRMGRGIAAGGLGVPVHYACQKVFGKFALVAFNANPALFYAIIGKGHAHQACHEKAHCSKGQAYVDGVGDMIGLLPYGGVGLGLARALGEARPKQIAISCVKLSAHQQLPDIENALAHKGLNGEKKAKEQGDPQGAAHYFLALAFLFVFVLQEANAHKAKGEQMKGQHAEDLGRENLPASGGWQAYEAHINEEEADYAANQGCGKEKGLQKFDPGPQEGAQHQQYAYPAKCAYIREK